jgi:hypothetical protein
MLGGIRARRDKDLSVTSGLNYRKGNATRPPQANKRDSGQPTAYEFSGSTRANPRVLSAATRG